ncbi:MAG: hypothetical protein EOP88_23080 [Verrucomicrobiaceae bacterium]|nr:MAG: hypothetical protein EOP88_23080 [Verrucomicrobiaceae bacterium]
MNYRIVLVGSVLAGWTVFTLLDAAAKAGILLAVALLVVLCMRRASSASRHLVWLCALTGALLLPLGLRFLPQWQVLPSWMRWEEASQLFVHNGAVANAFSALVEGKEIPIRESQSSDQTPVKYIPVTKTKAPEPESQIVRFPAKWLITGWGTVAGLLLLPVAISAFALRRRASKARRVTSGPLLDELDSVKKELGMRRAITLLEGSPEVMPMVWGILRYRLLLPEGADEWSAQRLRSVLLHEVSHLRRNDPLALLIGHFALAIHWFNPLAWYALRQLRIEQENACDDCVLRHGVRSSDYAAEMLSAVATFRTSGIDRFAALTMARPSGIETRISGILDSKRNRRSITRKLILVCATVAALAAVPVAMLRAGEPREIVRGRIIDRNGAVLAENPGGQLRSYPFGALVAHQVGYVRDNPKENEPAGIAGVESVYDGRLARGEDVTLALDLEIQQTVTQAMAVGGIKIGAAVVLDCRNGDLLASVSLPTYDNNQFIPKLSKENWNALRQDRDSPTNNRAFAAFTPGSTFKLLTAMAAARTGHAGEILHCTGYETYGNARTGCWIWNKSKGVHGELDLTGGLAQSCNCYFGQLVNKIGKDGMVEAAGLLGFGAPTGVGSPADSPGVVPGSHAWEKKFPNAVMTPHELAQFSMGQGTSLASPMQLAVLAATVANGEKVWVPRLDLDAPPQFRADLLEQGWDKNALTAVRAGMRACVSNGTGQAATSAVVEIAGTTGTAQTVKRGEPSHNAWFIGYAPAEDPKYAIAILAEGGESGGRICGPVARSIFETICAGE